MNEVRLIDANVLKEVIKANHYLLSAKNNSTDYGMFTTGIMQAIDNAPTVKTYCYFCGQTEHGKIEERPQGEWILLETDCDDGGNNRYECSECHYSDVHASSAEVPFCWHCGAGMKGGAE